MLTIRIGLNGHTDVAIFGAHNTGKEQDVLTLYDLYTYTLKGIRAKRPFGQVTHKREDGAVVLAKKLLEKVS